MLTIKELENQKKEISEQWEKENRQIFGSLGGYSQPVHQLKAIDDQIKRQQTINCGLTCHHCGANGCHYGIENGKYVYYCPACDNLI